MESAAPLPAPTLVTKAEFARRVKRSAGRVTQWIGEGKLHGPAIVPTAEGERIALEVAIAQLGITLDVGQQLGQESPILPLAASAPAARLPGLNLSANAEKSDAAATGGADAEPIDELGDRIKRAKVLSSEIRAEQDLIAYKAERGEWVRAADIRRAWSRNFNELCARIEAKLVLDPETAAALGVDAKEAALVLRRRFRAIREQLAAEAAMQRDTLPRVPQDDANLVVADAAARDLVAA